MQQAVQIDSTHNCHSGQKPLLTSLDSSNECSLDHWLEVYWLVEDEFVFAKDTDSEAWQEFVSGPH